MAHSSAWSGGAYAHSGAGDSYSYAGSNRHQKEERFGRGSGQFGGGYGGGQYASSSSSSGPGGHCQSSTMTSGPGGTFGTYHSSDDPGRVYSWRNPPAASGPPPAYSEHTPHPQNRQDKTTFHTSGNGQTRTVHTKTHTPYGTSSTMTSTTGNGRAHAQADHGRTNNGRPGSWRWWPS
ncbi:uncharacterized protein LOC121378457 [Gigantopelta aegis]|uniref:uncharacterized protein LOC121378457 n=1 Tax=Gigantopelta aegis TaxID=1735272 RepID=UPI001B88A592|nr:uncharacterized protein LOC121378457 [Gigantopelta aegis]XP_041362565.1 uncharacterized protein LOC121378457 [Gigantopelta aegis]